MLECKEIIKNIVSFWLCKLNMFQIIEVFERNIQNSKIDLKDFSKTFKEILRIFLDNTIYIMNLGDSFFWKGINLHWIRYQFYARAINFVQFYYTRYQLTLFLVILFTMISSVMQMMYAGMMSSNRRYQSMIAQRRMRMMRVMMTEESDCCGSGLMLRLHTLLDLALHLPENRMMRRPSCQMERKHGRRPLKQPGRR